MLAQALVLDDGETTIAIVAIDLVFAGAELTAAVRERVAGADRDPAGGRARERGAQPQRAEPLARLDVAGLADVPAFARYVELPAGDSSRAPSTRPGAHRRPARVGSGSAARPGITVNRVVPRAAGRRHRRRCSRVDRRGRDAARGRRRASPATRR